MNRLEMIVCSNKMDFACIFNYEWQAHFPELWYVCNAYPGAPADAKIGAAFVHVAARHCRTKTTPFLSPLSLAVNTKIRHDGP